MTSSPRRWAVVHRLRAGRRSLSIPRLFVEGVPPATARAVVVAALEDAGYAPLYSDGGVPWANHVVLPEERWPDGWVAQGPAPGTVRWDELVAPRARRAITIQVPPALWASIKLAAASDGVTMQNWCVSALQAYTARPVASEAGDVP